MKFLVGAHKSLLLMLIFMVFMVGKSLRPHHCKCTLIDHFFSRSSFGFGEKLMTLKSYFHFQNAIIVG